VGFKGGLSGPARAPGLRLQPGWGHSVKRAPDRLNTLL
jgi:hypothetical protein